ncbi:MAG: trehalose-phosphatase [Acidimicrobiia bacterium]|nr:trehalose-phosphatase [Acidimicrobiia bacterium]MYC57947.1 trehalose-phosphatase [Acidimicrobiia bacterium]MYG94634.1 trehalose-phosphatase [Acidimicrobiia bacterium]MYI30820.1 trehalose-phosphatase [Acidimicrobiia bacterium]
MLPVDVVTRVRELARTPVLLVACDYDGTLAPIVDNPDEARPIRESVAALRQLAATPDTHVAIISGRALRDLAALSRLPEEIRLVGSHGTEFDIEFTDRLSPEQHELRNQILLEISELAKRDHGFIIEPKPAGAAFHYRMANPATAAVAVQELLAGLAKRKGIHLQAGKLVLEFSVLSLTKGDALERIRTDVSAEAVMYTGDDVTDEDAFAKLTGPDLGLKVGHGISLAHARLSSPNAVAQVLALLAERRRAWLMGEQALPIERHSMLSDQRTIALVTKTASINWMCHPRADSPAVFASLLGGARAGHFSVNRIDASEPQSHRYVDETMVVETRWSDITVVDYLDCSDQRPHKPAGRTNLVRTLEGTGTVRIEFAPRLDFGRAPTGLKHAPIGLEIKGAAENMVLVSPGVKWEITNDGPHQTATAEVQLNGQPLSLILRLGVHGRPHHMPITEAERRQITKLHWRNWVQTLTLPPIASEEVERSALVLKALCYQPTGAILAAGTTSLPEVLGGVRNWDYRYCWPRDAAMTAASLLALGSNQEASDLLDWVLDRVEHLPSPEQLRPVYPLVGDEALPEAVLPELAGYAGSRPVRIGNAAEHQVQLDVFGPIVDLAWRMCKSEIALTKRHWELVMAVVGAVAARWHEPDHGIWEERCPPRHHVHSKVMCWMAVDRAVKIAERLEPEWVPYWGRLRHTIAADVIENGWNQSLKTYTTAYGSSDVDAALLWVGLSGLLPPSDSRFVSTIKAVEDQLRDGPTVYRYRHDDGLPGVEGGFLICTSWLIEAYVLIGQLDDARILFDRYLNLCGPTGLLAEQYDTVSERALGNFPQAYSHLGLINAALALSQTDEG